MIRRQKSMVPGICFIAIGLWFLAHYVMGFSALWPKTYPILLLFFGGILFWEALRRRQNGTAFWGTVLFMVGLFFLLRNHRIIHYLFAEEYWPFFLVVLGFGFFAIFLFHPRDWGFLFPSCIFIFFGLAAASHTLYGRSVEWLEQILHFWPVLLILMGIGLIVSGLKKI
jgi:hypothetical protein